MTQQQCCQRIAGRTFTTARVRRCCFACRAQAQKSSTVGRALSNLESKRIIGCTQPPPFAAHRADDEGPLLLSWVCPGSRLTWSSAGSALYTHGGWPSQSSCDPQGERMQSAIRSGLHASKTHCDFLGTQLRHCTTRSGAILASGPRCCVG